MSTVSTPPSQQVRSGVDDDHSGECPDSPLAAYSTGSSAPLSPVKLEGSSLASSPDRFPLSSIKVSQKDEVSIAENPFDSEDSRVLFDAIDKFQSCGAGGYIDIPQVCGFSFCQRGWRSWLMHSQLVIVGAQSAGKSSLLQSLTDIPFPVKDGCCTRFATRIVSRRTAPGTSNQVKVTIVPPDFRVEDFNYVEDESYKDYVQIKESLTTDEFSDIVEEVSPMSCHECHRILYRKAAHHIPLR
jgi:hypothetical protein